MNLKMGQQKLHKPKNRVKEQWIIPKLWEITNGLRYMYEVLDQQKIFEKRMGKNVLIIDR